MRTAFTQTVETTRTYEMCEEHVQEACREWLEKKNKKPFEGKVDVTFSATSYGDFRCAIVTVKTKVTTNE